MLSGAEVHGLGWAPYERRSELVRFGLRTRLVPICRTVTLLIRTQARYGRPARTKPQMAYKWLIGRGWPKLGAAW